MPSENHTNPQEKKMSGKKITQQIKGNCTAQLHLYAVLTPILTPVPVVMLFYAF
jgi:hypothetical protein